MKQVKRAGLILVALSALGVSFARPSGYTTPNGNAILPLELLIQQGLF